ncbi:MAG: hypothetical protein M1821_009275 [Bathelium mastoideum]|nr:MAG: hypothetical protein M1821_009275 [Bathelium mastoideum]
MTVAFRAYESLKQEFEGNVILTAIFIPKVAIIIQTKVHSPQAATEIINMANEHVKRWYKKVYEPRREANPTLAIEKLIHAEDGAVVRGGNAYAKSFGLTSLGELVRLPKKTKVANYGKYHAGDTAGPKQSCAQWCRGMLELMIAPDT